MCFWIQLPSVVCIGRVSIRARRILGVHDLFLQLDLQIFQAGSCLLQFIRQPCPEGWGAFEGVCEAPSTYVG